VNESGGSGSTRFAALLRTVEAETAAVESHVRGRKEQAVLKLYGQAAESYRFFLRFRELDPGAAGGMLLLRGPNRPVAIRYGIPFEERGGGRWVNRKTAMQIFAAKAEDELTAARSRRR